MDKLPEWPKFDRQGYLDPPDSVLLEYERERAEAAITRLKVATTALANIRDRERFDQDGIWYRMPSGEEMQEHAETAITLIGDIPE